MNTYTELEEMRAQLAILNKKLKKEAIVNERLMRSSMKDKAWTLRRKAIIEAIITIIGIPYFICVLYFSYSERSAKLKALMNENIGFKSSNLISIRDSRGVLQLI